MGNLEDMVKKTEEMIGQLKREESEEKRIKGVLLQELKKLVDSIPSYPFYNKYKAILAKTIIDLQYLT